MAPRTRAGARAEKMLGVRFTLAEHASAEAVARRHGVKPVELVRTWFTLAAAGVLAQPARLVPAPGHAPGTTFIDAVRWMVDIFDQVEPGRLQALRGGPALLKAAGALRARLLHELAASSSTSAPGAAPVGLPGVVLGVTSLEDIVRDAAASGRLDQLEALARNHRLGVDWQPMGKPLDEVVDQLVVAGDLAALEVAVQVFEDAVDVVRRRAGAAAALPSLCEDADRVLSAVRPLGYRLNRLDGATGRILLERVVEARTKSAPSPSRPPSITAPASGAARSRAAATTTSPPVAAAARSAKRGVPHGHVASPAQQAWSAAELAQVVAFVRGYSAPAEGHETKARRDRTRKAFRRAAADIEERARPTGRVPRLSTWGSTVTAAVAKFLRTHCDGLDGRTMALMRRAADDVEARRHREDPPAPPAAAAPPPVPTRRATKRPQQLHVLPELAWKRAWLGRGAAHTLRRGDEQHTVCGLEVKPGRWRTAPKGARDCGSCASLRDSRTAHGAEVGDAPAAPAAPSAPPAVEAAPGVLELSAPIEAGKLKHYCATVMTCALERAGIGVPVAPARAEEPALRGLPWVERAAIKLLRHYRAEGAALHVCARCGGASPAGLPTCPYCGEGGGPFAYLAWEKAPAKVVDAPAPPAASPGPARPRTLVEAFAAADEARKPPVDRAQTVLDDKVATLLDAGVTPFMLLMLETGATAVEIGGVLI
jgi:hypothetical protein